MIGYATIINKEEELDSLVFLLDYGNIRWKKL